MVYVVFCKIIVSAPSPSPFPLDLDLGFGTWIWDLDLGLDLGLTKSKWSHIPPQWVVTWQCFKVYSQVLFCLICGSCQICLLDSWRVPLVWCGVRIYGDNIGGWQRWQRQVTHIRPWLWSYHARKHILGSKDLQCLLCDIGRKCCWVRMNQTSIQFGKI